MFHQTVVVTFGHLDTGTLAFPRGSCSCLGATCSLFYFIGCGFIFVCAPNKCKQ